MSRPRPHLAPPPPPRQLIEGVRVVRYPQRVHPEAPKRVTCFYCGCQRPEAVDRCGSCAATQVVVPPVISLQRQIQYRKKQMSLFRRLFFGTTESQGPL